jgi:hypothetical protein
MTYPIYNFTPAAAQQQLQNDGLDTLGLTTVALSPHWDTIGVNSYNEPTRTLQTPGQLRAPFRGILQGAFAPANSVLQNALLKTDTSFDVFFNMGNLFPNPIGSGGGVVLTLANSDGSKREFVLLTGRNGPNANGDTFKVDRGYDGSAIQDFDAGDSVSLRLGRNNTPFEFSDANGLPLQMTCAIYRFHPQAVLRLARLMAARYENNSPALIRPVPHAMVIHNAGFYRSDQFFEADDPLPLVGSTNLVFSFHDGRGLIIDPVYVAALFADLLAAFPLLQPASVMGGVGDPGGINTILNLPNATGKGTLFHFVNPHGGTFQPPGTDGPVTATNIQPAPVLVTTGFVEIPPGQVATVSAIGPNGTLRWGWATNGTMTAVNLTPPALPPNVNLVREFFRVCVTDINWALLGNRTNGNVLGVQKDDGRLLQEFPNEAASFLPEVRDQVTIDYLVDGLDTLAEITRVLQRPNQTELAVSMLWDGTVITPPVLGPPAHWPAFPPPNMGAIPPGVPAQIPFPLPAGAVTAAFSTQNAQDVVVTLTGVAPFDSHVRIYPQRFVEIEAIGPEPSFVRGDGGANITAGAAVFVLLPNPFDLEADEPPLDPAELTLDIVITPRMGNRRMFAAVNVTVTGAVAPVNPFVGPPVPPTVAMFQGIAPSPLFGVPVPIPTPPPPNTATFGDLLMSFVADSMPRQASRLPTQARFETMVAGGVPNPNIQTLVWDAVVSGARFAQESRSAAHDLGNPGNPAGPDIHAPGVRVTGALAYDVAYAAMRRAEPMIPWPGFNQNFPGWIFTTMGDNFNAPSDAANVNNTSTGVLLRTIARACENSLLSEKNIPSDTGLDPETWINQALNAANIPVTFNNQIQIQNGPRIRKEVRREFFISKHGLRDSQWSLLRAISEARELVYIESPQFARTARPHLNSPQAYPQDYEVDLVQTLASRLQLFANLKVIICTPRLSDFTPKYKSWAHQHYAVRTEAVGNLLAVAKDRVAVFHPVGFPGRPAFIRTTSVIVDDVWALVGATHFRRRGMTFDGSVAVASFDRQMENGYSKKVRAYRQALMAAKLRVPAPLAGQAPSGDWVRLGRPKAAFALIQDMLAQGGLGRIQPLWPGPFENVLAVQPETSDPDGSTSNDYSLFLIDGILNEAGG